MMSSLDCAVTEEISEFHVAAHGGRGARALACLLADVARLQGMVPLSVHASTELLGARRPDQPESATLRLSGGHGSVRISAVLNPQLMNMAGVGLLLVNSREPISTETVRTVDADGIAQSLGIPAYLPMVGAVARTAGWTDLDRMKAAVRFALEAVAPYWVEAGLIGVETGYHTVVY